MYSVLRRFAFHIDKTTIDVLDSPDVVYVHPGWSLQRCLLALTARFASHLGTGHSCIRRFCARFPDTFALRRDVGARPKSVEIIYKT